MKIRGLHECKIAGAVLIALAFLPGSSAAAEAAGHFQQGAWPFCSPVRPGLPPTTEKSWIINPIDAFVLSKLEDAGLSPNAPADKATLLRRVTFDLVGLPPTPEELRAFLADESPGAYDRVVDRLLGSPGYGEHWAQHWLDLVRYAETDGFKEDALRPAAYKYRDYVIRALNADLPYDRFICQQLAGDELEPDNPDALVATGLNRLYSDEYNAADVRQRRQEILDDLTDTTGLVFFGLTIGCAQCHDHKFDKILQTDYYRLQAFFTPMLPRDDMSAATPDQRQQYAERLSAWEESTKDVRQRIEELVSGERDKLLQDALEKFEPTIREAVLAKPEARSPYQKQLAAQATKYVNSKMKEAPNKLTKEQKQEYAELQKQLAEFDSLKPEPLPVAMAIQDASAQSPPTFRFAGGNFKRPLEEVQPGFPLLLDTGDPDIHPPAHCEAATGRRSALAKWLCRPDHPLTARIMMNRLWSHHFGQGIVGTPNDFGMMGEPPTHPELLDWLAVEFVEAGWSLKAMHRLMVTSAAYRQSSLVDAENPQHAKALEADAENLLLWHARRRRLEGEAIRDAVLHLASNLGTRMFGPSAHPQLPDGVGTSYAWAPDKEGGERNRRSVYVLAKRNMRFPLFDVFDYPDMHNSCPRRSNTTTAPQALALLNGDLPIEGAQAWGARLAGSSSNDHSALVQNAYLEALGREPTPEEASDARQFIEKQMATIAGAQLSQEPAPGDSASGAQVPCNCVEAKAAAVADFCHALLSCNDFLYVD